MSITVITPVLNEATFLPLYLPSVASFADEVIIVDGGSTDGSIDIVKSFMKKHSIRLYTHRQGTAYSDEWNESEVRNFMIDQARGDWIANIDADEIFDDALKATLPELLARSDADVLMFPIVNFWKDPWTVRINAPNDERWSNDIIRMWRNGRGIRYRNQKHHCTLESPHGEVWALPSQRLDIPLYHYHYAFGNRFKFNDNRRGDVNLYNNVGEPDWSYRHDEYTIKLIPFVGKHPEVVTSYMNSKSV